MNINHEPTTDAPPPKRAIPPNPFKVIPERTDTAPAVEPVRIGINDRWLFVLRPPPGAALGRDRLQTAKDELERWWASGEKFCVVGILPGVEVSVQRVDE